MGWIGSIFNYLNSVLVKDTHDRIFRRYTSNTPVDNESSLNITIRLKIIEIANITVIKTSVLALYLLVHYLIFNLPLLCTSSWRFEIRLPPIYVVIEFSPDDQIQPKLFVLVKSTDIYISSHKLSLNRPIPMEVRFNTFPFSCVNKEFSISILNNFKRIFLVMRYRVCPTKCSVEPEHARHVLRWSDYLQAQFGPCV